MTIHLIKLCVGIESVADLEASSERRCAALRRAGEPELLEHVTRMFPKRRDEILDDGSLYWVIKGRVQARQRIVDLEEVRAGDGIPRCRIVLDPDIIPTDALPRAAFQGWRYFKPEDAPSDLRGDRGGDAPPALRAELAELGLL